MGGLRDPSYVGCPVPLASGFTFCDLWGWALREVFRCLVPLPCLGTAWGAGSVLGHTPVLGDTSSCYA